MGIEQNLPELALSIIALVYAVSLLIWRLPLGWFRRHGWEGMMHSFTSIAVLTAVGSLALVKSLISPYIENLLGVNLDATFSEAFQSLNMYRSMVNSWINSVNLAALALGGTMAVILLALSPLYTIGGGVGILVSSIVSYLVSSVFGLLNLMQKAFSSILLFVESISSLLMIAQAAAPVMFLAGIILYSTPFGRKLGKTLMVLGAGLTLALPVVVVNALPSPQEQQEEIEKTREIQAYSIALKNIQVMQAGVRINILDRNGTILLKGGGETFHESKVVNYPYFKLTQKEIPGPTFIDCSILPPGVSCEQVAQAVVEMIQQPETGFIDSMPGYYNSREDGYRVSLTMPSPARNMIEFRQAEYLPDSWVLGLWIYMQGDDRKRDSPVTIYGREIPEKPKEIGPEIVCDDISCVFVEPDPYNAWKKFWEEYWQSTKYKKLYAENMVQEGEKTSFIWFTKRSVESNMPLNLFMIYPPIREFKCVRSGVENVGNETRYKYRIVVKVAEDTITYFAYLDGAEYSVESDPEIEIREVKASDLVGKVVKDAGNLTLHPSLETVVDAPILEASPPAHYMEVYFPGGEIAFQEAYSCEAAYYNYLKETYEDLMLEDNSTNPNVNAYRECFEDKMDEYDDYAYADSNSTLPDIIPEPDSNSTSTTVFPACVGPEGVQPIPVTLYFELKKESPLAPYIPPVDWEQFRKDDKQFDVAASDPRLEPNGIKGVYLETHREDWKAYPTFEQGLYRSGPPQFGSRLLTSKLQEYRIMTWQHNPLAAAAEEILREAMKMATGQTPESPVEIPVVRTLIGDNGMSVGLIQVSKVVAYAVALGYGLLLFVAGLDAVSWFIGGESAGKKIVMAGASAIMYAFTSAGTLVKAMRGYRMPSTITEIMARRKRDEMLKHALEERKRDRETWGKMVSKRIEYKKLKEQDIVFRRATELGEKLKSKTSEKILDEAEKLGEKGLLGRFAGAVLREPARGYVLEQHRFNLLTNPDYAKRNIQDSIYVKQSRPVAMKPRDFTEGLAKVSEGLSFKERLALADQYARQAPEIGKAIVSKKILSYMSPYISDKISAPAAFKVASDMSKPVDGRDFKPNIPYTSIPDFKVGMWTRGLEEPRPPTIQTSNEPLRVFKEASDIVKYVESNVRPLKPEEKSGITSTLIDRFVDGPPEWSMKIADIEPSRQVDSGFKVVDVKLEGGVSFEASPETAKHFVDYFIDSNRDVGGSNLFKGLEEFSWRDNVGETQEYQFFKPLRDSESYVYSSGDLREMFTDALPKDGIDMIYYEKGVSIGEVFEKISSPNTGTDSNESGRWWE